VRYIELYNDIIYIFIYIYTEFKTLTNTQKCSQKSSCDNHVTFNKYTLPVWGQ